MLLVGVGRYRSFEAIDFEVFSVVSLDVLGSAVFVRLEWNVSNIRGNCRIAMANFSLTGGQSLEFSGDVLGGNGCADSTEVTRSEAFGGILEVGAEWPLDQAIVLDGLVL